MKKCRHTWLIICLMILLPACTAVRPENMEAPSQGPTWQEQYDLGARYLSEGNYEEAILAFTAAIEVDPKQAPAYVGRGDAYVLSGETEKNLAAAKTDYEKALELDETLVNVYLSLADIYITQGNIDLAIAILEQGFSVTGEMILEEKANTLSETAKKIPGEWGTYAPFQHLSIPLDVTIISSEGVQPTDNQLSHQIHVFDGRCSYSSSGPDSDNVRTILFGGLCTEYDAWSDGGEYMIDLYPSSAEFWQRDLERDCPLSYENSRAYESQIKNGQFADYEELFNEYKKIGSKGIVSTNGGEMMNRGNSMWCLILAAYDSNGVRVGYVVYQINNTTEIIETCTVYIDETTGEIIP